MIGDPGPDSMFDFAVYARGATTLHQLRLAEGDADFFEILQTWTTSNAGGHVTTADFIGLSEDISGQQLDDCSRRGCSRIRSPSSSKRRCGRKPPPAVA